jgi:hypothetical protein
MGVKHSTAPDLGVVANCLFLPSSNTVLQFVKKDLVNFDRSSLKGWAKLSVMLTKLRAEAKGFKHVVMSYPAFLSREKNHEKVAYLGTIGIVSEDGRTTFDFSNLPKQAPRKPQKTGTLLSSVDASAKPAE